MRRRVLGKVFHINYAILAMAACFLMLLYVPIIGTSMKEEGVYCKVMLDGEEIGAVAEPEVVEEAFLHARARIAREIKGLVFADVHCEFEQVSKIFGSTLDKEDLEEIIYQVLQEKSKKAKHKSYLVKVNDYMVNLSSLHQVEELLRAAVRTYDKDEHFDVAVVSDNTRELNTYAAEVITVNEPEEGDGLKDLRFAEKVEIAEAYISSEDVMDLDDAIAEMTKDREKNQTYEVQPGDTLSVIANSRGFMVADILELNPGLTKESTLRIGDQIVMSVPEPELSINTQTQSTYDEEYSAPVEYIDNDDWYTNKTEVRQEGSPGQRRVTVLVTNKNDVEVARDVLDETVLEAAVPRIVERGTQTPPNYVKPISGGRFTSGFKWRWGRMHKGVDWAVPIGTTIFASCGGTVASAGWSGGYGYCVMINHPDGRQTRYGHMSKVLVKAGQKVKQGEKIGLSGNTGRSTGPHVHFEILIGGKQVNPLSYIK